MIKIIVFGNCLQNTVGLVRSVGEKGFPVDLLLEPCKKSDCYIRFSKYVSKIHYLARTEDAVAVLLTEYSTETVKPIIFCGSDPTISLLDNNYDILKNYFYIFNARSQQGRINHFLNKVNTFEVAKKHGLTLIQTWTINNQQTIPQDIIYPCFTKGRNSIDSNKGDIHICNSKEELKGYLRDGVEYLVQDYIRKDYEVMMIGLSYNHGKNVIIPGVIRKIREDLVRMGEFMRLDDANKYQNINFDGIKKLVAEIGYEGIFSVEMLCKGDTYYFLEINLRNDGLAYINTAAGANYPYLWIKYVTGNLSEKDIRDIRLKTPFHVMHENDLYNIVEGKVSLGQWIKDFLKSDAFLIMNWKDPMPFIASTCIHARQACKKVMRKFFHTNRR